MSESAKPHTTIRVARGTTVGNSETRWEREDVIIETVFDHVLSDEGMRMAIDQHEIIVNEKMKAFYEKFKFLESQKSITPTQVKTPSSPTPGPQTGVGIPSLTDLNAIDWKAYEEGGGSWVRADDPKAVKLTNYLMAQPKHEAYFQTSQGQIKLRLSDPKENGVRFISKKYPVKE